MVLKRSFIGSNPFFSLIRYRRRKETKDLLEFVHGGEDAAINGAWDFVTSQCSQEKMEELVASFSPG